MLKACKYCGRVHDSKLDCGKKPQHKKNTDIDRLRWGKAWQNKRTEIKERDNYLCQVCFRNLYNTNNRLAYNNISVHHAIPIEQDREKYLDNDNLITLCSYHHELAEKKEIPLKVILNIIKEQENNPPGGAWRDF